MIYKRISGVIFIYITMFMFLSLGLGNFLINYISVDFVNIILFMSCFLMFAFGALVGERVNFFIVNKIPIRLITIIKISIWSSFIGTVACWYYNIKYWGSISYILSHAMLIRDSMIGGNADFIPTIWSYLASFSYLALICSLFLFDKNNNGVKKKKKIIYCTCSFILVILLDMIYFGRIGAVFSFLTIFAYIVTFFPLSKIFNKKTFLLFIVVIALVNAPRIIRGGGDLFLASVDDKIKSINVPVNIYTAGPIINYIYYFSSPYSFNQWMEKDFNTTEFTYGSRTFTPFYNILSKLYGNERVVIIDENAYIPFRHNIFSVVKDYYSDFGFWGVILIPFTIGLICGKSIKSFYLTARLSKIDCSYGILGVFFLSYILYSPLYNILSFGKFFIPLVMILFLSILFRVK